MGYKSYFEDKKKALETYKPELTRAEDFWDFWQETIKSVNGKNLDPIRIQIEYPSEYVSKGQILRSTSNTAPLTCGACNTQPEGLLTMA